VEEIEVEYAPYQAEQPLQDEQKVYELEEEQITGVAVVTGVATGAAVDEACPNTENGDEDVVTGVAAGAAVDEVCPSIENGGEGAVTLVTAVDESCPTIEHGDEDATKALDNSNGLDETPTAPEPPTAPKYWWTR
jgi:hypothetical protein